MKFSVLTDLMFSLKGKLVETEDSPDDSETDKSSSSKEKVEKLEGTVYLKKTLSGDFLVKRNFTENPSDTIHLRKTVRLSNDGENRSMVQINQEIIKKGDSENQVLVPIKLHSTSDIKDIHNTLIVNKNSKSMSDKKNNVHNQQSVSSMNCIRQTVVSESDGISFLKSRRVNKLDDVVNDACKKFKRNEC